MSIVVGYVPTSEGRAALSRAAVEAVLRQVDLVVVHAPTQGVGHPGDAESDGEGDDADLTQAMQVLTQAGLLCHRRTASQRDDFSEQLITVAEDIEAEFIVIGLRRRSKVGKLILGSNAQRVLLDAGCPVLAVKADEQG